MDVNRVAKELMDWLNSQGMACVLHEAPTPTGIAAVECSADPITHGFRTLLVEVRKNGVLMEMENLTVPPYNLQSAIDRIYRDLDNKVYSSFVEVGLKMRIDAYELKQGVGHMDVLSQVLSTIKENKAAP